MIQPKNQATLNEFCLSQVQIISPADNIDTVSDVFVKDKQISIGKAPPNFKAQTTFSLPGYLLVPGAIDLYARLPLSLSQGSQTLLQELQAALASGITQICQQPTIGHPLDNGLAIDKLKHLETQCKTPKIFPMAALTLGLQGNQLANMALLKKAGASGFSQPIAIKDTRLLRNALAYAASFDYAVMIQAQEFWLAQQGIAHAGIVSSTLGLPANYDYTESIEVYKILQLVKETGCKVHFSKISCAESVALIAQAKQDKLPITADVSIAHLFFTEFDIQDFSSPHLTCPPLRSQKDLEALRQGIVDNHIDAICSDHFPLSQDDKCQPLSMAQAGFSSFETFIPLCLELAKALGCSYSQIINKITQNPARILNEKPVSVLGANNSFCLLAPTSWQIFGQKFQSLGKITPFESALLSYKPAATYFDADLQLTGVLE